ncbi:MAG: ZIP family metal transporter [Elusimicrobiota bacterium]|jgi:ZIP family zinc transporter/zinc and cadmium transporter|nr:ZIP family metal transporter [Elusimicrobiota bacterium]
MAIIYSLIAACAAMLGTVLVLRLRNWSENNSLFLINFAAGVMIAIAFVHLMPEALKANENAVIWTLAGFTIMFFLQFVILFHPSHEKSLEDIGHFSIISMSFHSALDGLIVAIGFEANTGIGIITTVAILLHKLPDGITISGILLHSGQSIKKIFRFSLLTAAFTPIGAILGVVLFKNISYETLGALLGITAGSFIFLAAADLIPETHKSKNRLVPLTFFMGILAMIITKIIFRID